MIYSSEGRKRLLSAFIFGFIMLFYVSGMVRAAGYPLEDMPETTGEFMPEDAMTEEPTTEQPTTEVVVNVEIPTEEAEEIDVLHFEPIEDDSARNARRCQIWTFYLLLIWFAFDIIKFFDTRMEKTFRRMGKD